MGSSLRFNRFEKTTIMNNTIHQEALMLTAEVGQIVKKQEEFELATGVRFNLFSVLRIQSKEELTHSRFIAELLNPKGKHGKGSLFLELFLHQLEIDDVKVEGAKIHLEYSIGNISKKKSEGGRIDIYIEASGKNIIIENKIYADEQKEQLVRYSNSRSNAHLLYLTLFGDLSSDHDRLTNGDHLLYRPISYSSDILNWLQLCIKEAHNLPFVRENIQQYINLVSKLTNQSISNKMTNELVSSIAADDNKINGFSELLKLETAVRNELIESYMVPTLELIAQDFNNSKKLSGDKELKLEIDLEYFKQYKKEYKSFNYTSNSLIKKGIQFLRFEFIVKSGWTSLVYGIKLTKDKGENQEEFKQRKIKLYDALSEVHNNTKPTLGHELWAGFYDMNLFSNFNSISEWQQVKSIEFKDEIMKKLELLYNSATKE